MRVNKTKFVERNSSQECYHTTYIQGKQNKQAEEVYNTQLQARSLGCV